MSQFDKRSPRQRRRAIRQFVERARCNQLFVSRRGMTIEAVKRMAVPLVSDTRK